MAYNNLEEYLVPASYFTQGGLWGWGSNSFGNLGDNSTANTSSPIQTISGSANWKQCSSGEFFTTAIKTDGTLWTWGYNTTGQLGDNTSTPKSSPIQTISGGANWKLVAAGRYHTAAIKTDGTLWLWGLNTNGQLGDGTAGAGTQKSSPVQTVAIGNNWKSVTGGDHTVAIKTDGTLWLWGRNNYGQLGVNDRTDRSSPVQTISTGTNWKSISASWRHTAAIKTDGTLWTWGDNLYGQLGDGTSARKSSPVQTVSGGTNWKQVSCGYYSIVAIKTDGTLWNWGRNTYGGLGDSSITTRNSPVQTVAGGTNWKQASAGEWSSAAIKTDGTLWLWGYAVGGILGDNTVVSKSSPVQTIAGGTNWKQVEMGAQYSTAINGTWGTIT